MAAEIEFSVITPTCGERPKGLRQAVESVAAAAEAAGDALPPGAVEMLIGFDGLKGDKPQGFDFVRCFNLPLDNDYGNGIRRILLQQAKGRRLVFVDDDNVLAPEAFRVYLRHPEAELIIARIDTSRAFPDAPYLPVDEEGRSLVRQNNVDPLCLCVSRELAVVRCGGWSYTNYVADYLAIRDFHRRSRSTVVLEDVVGVYDAGRGLDDQSETTRRMLTRKDGRSSVK
jgi:hypothetical protein